MFFFDIEGKKVFLVCFAVAYTVKKVFPQCFFLT
jgi:hypothetical protein